MNLHMTFEHVKYPESLRNPSPPTHLVATDGRSARVAGVDGLDRLVHAVEQDRVVDPVHRDHLNTINNTQTNKQMDKDVIKPWAPRGSP